jgi:hypothetical protein
VPLHVVVMAGRGLTASALLLVLIHRSTWKGNSQKFACRILHRSPSRSREGGFWGHLRPVYEAYMLWC